MKKSDINRLHPNDLVLWHAVEAATFKLAECAKLKLNWVRPLPKWKCEFWFGMYHGHPDRGIEIGLRDRLDGCWASRPHRLYLIVNTIAHELAHLQVGCQANHGNKWTAAYGELLTFASMLDLRADLKKSGAKFTPD